MRQTTDRLFAIGISLLMLAAPTLAADASLPYYDSPEFTPRWITADSDVPQAFHRIPDFSFTNQDGRVIDNREIAGRVYVASFFFSTCPGICPAIRSKLAMVQARFIDEDGVRILSHSIRPSTDTVEVLRAYATDNDVVSGKWHLLTGDRDAIYALATDAYFANEDLGAVRSAKDFLHTENLLLIDTDRRIRGVYNGLSVSSVNHLIGDIETLLAEDRD